MRVQPVAYRYAKSLMALALEQGQLEQVRTDVRTLNEVCEGSDELRAILRSPVLRADQKQRVLDRVFEGRLTKLTHTFITVLTRKGREALLPEIAEAFEGLYREHKGIVTCRVTSAVKLSPAELDQARNLTAARYPGKTIEVQEIIDPDIIGGGIIQVGDLQWDASLRTKLHVIRRTFAENPYIPKF